jgi:hypothetical protein
MNSPLALRHRGQSVSLTLACASSVERIAKNRKRRCVRRKLMKGTSHARQQPAR